MTTAGTELPRDARVVIAILKSMGVHDYEPRVVNQFLELSYRYATDVLGDAQAYAEHAGRRGVDVDDVKLAIQSRVNFSFTQPPPREIVMELARARNAVPLPKVVGRPGIALPPEHDTLVQPNYQIATSSAARPRPGGGPQGVEMEVEVEEPEREGADEKSAEGDGAAEPQQSTERGPGRVSFAVGTKRPRS
eukprot:jgi/Mesen1/2910/ME000175S02066